MTPRVKDDIEVRIPGLPQKRSLAEHVYEGMKKQILKGELKPGTRIVESRIASKVGISRTPVREALHRLEKEGLLKRSLAGTLYVADFTKEDIQETFGIRAILESYAAKLATIRHSKKDLASLEKKVALYEEALEKGDKEALPRINTEFHELLYKLSKSPRLIRMINELRDHIARYREVILKDEDMALQSKEDHRKMLELMKKRDAQGVEEIVKEHILRGQDLVMGLVEKEAHGRR